MKPGQALPTEPELAKKHRTTRTTVRRAFGLLVNKGLVTKTAGRGTFVSSEQELLSRKGLQVAVVAPESFVQSVGMSRSGYVVDGSAGGSYYQYLEAVACALSARGRSMSLYHVESALSDYSQIGRRIAANANIGIIVIGAEDEPCVGALADTGLPVVCVDSIVDSLHADVVNGDDRGGCRNATRHLLTTTRGPVAFLGHDESDPRMPQRLRFEGFVDAHRDVGRRFDEQYLIGVERVLPSDGREAAHRIVGMSKPPAGVMCGNDALALGLMQVLAESGTGVPVDMSVMGFGNTIYSMMIVPSISSVAPDRMAMGERAAELLEKRIESPSQRPRTVFVPTRLILRHTTMPAPEVEAAGVENAEGT